MDKKNEGIAHKPIVSGRVSLCEKSDKEWQRLKRFSDDGGWELLAQFNEQARKWREQEKKDCH